MIPGWSNRKQKSSLFIDSILSPSLASALNLPGGERWVCKLCDSLITSTQNKRSQTHIASVPVTFTAAPRLTCALSPRRLTVFPPTLSGLKPQAPQIAITTSLPLCRSAAAAYYVPLNSTQQLPALWSSLLFLTKKKTHDQSRWNQGS